MSNLTQFTTKQNLNLLWSLILDELNINKSNKNLMSNINAIFEGNINPFTTRANQKLNLMELNKQFLSQVVLAVDRLLPNLKQEQNIKRITISDEDIHEPYKVEDIHASRQNDFEKEVERKRMDLENYMTPQKPRDMDFSDKQTDGKIKSMDSLIAEKMAQRNLEITQLQNITSIDPDKWLVPKETSIKNEKIAFETKQEQDHIQKKVSWNVQDEEPTINIFNKLKKQQNLTVSLDEPTQYVEQTSMLLPEVKQEEINRNQSTISTYINEPMLPKTEIIKQLNEMNKKIDTLYELILKLTNELTKNTNTVLLVDAQISNEI